MANGLADPLPQGYKESGRAATPIVRTGVAIYRGQELHYEVIDGLAVHDGDLILGTVEEVLEEQRRLRSTKAATGLQPARRDAAIKEDRRLWPDGIVPYVIEPGFSGRVLKYIDEAIHEWNSKTVITLVKRTTEPDYLRFRLEDDPLGCSASLERKFVNLTPGACKGLSSVIHEIGHAVGVSHEFQRYDRDDYVSVSEQRTYGGSKSFRGLPGVPGRGPFDYSSIMQYSDDTIETVPPGIPLRAGRLSSGDIDGVARLYGTVPTATTITTNPSGLAILVDGENHTTPVRFNWSPGTTHTLEAVSPQTVGAERFIFGRWSDEGGVRRTILADADATWYEANYIVQRKMLSCPQTSEVGGVEIRPESPDDFYVQRQPVEVYAKPADRLRKFLQWNPVPTLRRPGDRRSRRSSPANSSNPAIGNSPRWSRWSSGNSEIGESTAIYTAKPIFLVDSNIDGIRILAGGRSRKLPWAFPADAYPNGIRVEALAVVPEQLELENVRYRFTSWSDGGMRAHQIRVPASGGRVGLEVTREYRINVRSRNQRNENAIEISPLSEDGFYTEGTVVRVTANPSQGHRLAGWVGEISGYERSQTVEMDSAKLLEAVFTTSVPLQPGESKSVTLQASDQFQLYGDSRGYSVLVPRDSSELTVRFQSSVGEVDLYVHRGQSPWHERGGSAQTPRIYANFASASPGPTERITINRASIPRLANDVYFIALAVPPGQGQIEGTLSVEVRRSGIVKSRPQALTFVSPLGFDAGPQRVRLTHETTSTARYKIESNASWLTARPQEWVSSGSGVQEVSVVTNTAGLSLDTHRASLSVLKASSSHGDTTWAETGVEIPVTFAVVPSSATSRRANAVVIEGGPQEGDTYGAGEQIRIAVNFTDPVEVTGLPVLNLRVGNRMRRVPWTGRGSTSVCEGGYKSLEFGYVVQTEDLDNDGIGIGTNGLTLNGGTIRTVNGADSILALGGPLTAGVAQHKVDGSVAAVPRIDYAGISSNPPNGVAYAAGEWINPRVRFGIPVEVDGSPRLALNAGGRTRYAILYRQSSDRRLLSFRYEVQPQDVDKDGISVPANALALNGGSIRSAAGANADLDLGTHAIENAAQHKVDGSVAAVPRVDYAGISSNPPNGVAYAAGEWINPRVRFGIPVEVDGSPRLALNVGGRTRYAILYRQSSDRRLLSFRYEVQPQDVDKDGISVPANALALNGGSIRSAAGANADLDLGTHAIENAAQHKVDGSVAAVPRVDYAGISSNPPNGVAYAAGEWINPRVRFGIPVEVDGSPRLALNIGGRTRYAILYRQSSDGRELSFRYEVQPQDQDTDGISIPAAALILNGGRIRSAAGVDADLNLGTHAITNAPNHKVDGGG